MSCRRSATSLVWCTARQSSSMCSRWSARRDEVRLISTMSSHRPSRFLEQVVGLDVGVDEAVPEWGRERVVGALERNGIGEEPLAGVGRQHQQLPRCQGRGVAQPSQRLVLGQRWRSGVEMVQLPTAQARSRVLGIPGVGK